MCIVSILISMIRQWKIEYDNQRRNCIGMCILDNREANQEKLHAFNEKKRKRWITKFYTEDKKIQKRTTKVKVDLQCKCVLFTISKDR